MTPRPWAPPTIVTHTLEVESQLNTLVRTLITLESIHWHNNECQAPFQSERFKHRPIWRDDRPWWTCWRLCDPDRHVHFEQHGTLLCFPHISKWISFDLVYLLSAFLYRLLWNLSSQFPTLVCNKQETPPDANSPRNLSTGEGRAIEAFCGNAQESHFEYIKP